MDERRPAPPEHLGETSGTADTEELLRERRRKRRRRQLARKRRRRRRLLACGAALLGASALFFAVRTAVTGTDREPERAAADSSAPADSAALPAADSTFADASVGEGAETLPADTGTDADVFAQNGSRAALSAAENAAQSPLSQTARATDGGLAVGDALFLNGYTVSRGAQTAAPSESDVQSAHAVLIDAGTGMIAAERDADARISPASMTKVLTVLTAAELLTDPDEPVTVTQEDTDYAYRNDCSIAGFQPGDTVTVRDLFYATILPSGADAALALAVHAAGSHEAFAEQMNRKVSELGLTGSHFTNCVGVFDEGNYSTCTDMAMILKAALENDFCREVLTAKRYTTSPTAAHPEGLELSNWFLRRIEDKDSGGTVLAGKTGFVNESGNCAVSYAVSASGTPYLCCTAGAHSAWRCIYDHVALYRQYQDDTRVK